MTRKQTPAGAGYYATRAELRRRLNESAPARVQLVTGPRQVGKTTLLLELAQEWGKQALYLAADAPEAALPGWWERQWRKAMDLARRGTALLLLDEIHFLPHWSRQLKVETDLIQRERVPLHIVVTGSAALRLGVGTRESMAGRFERLVLIHWSARDLAQAFHLAQGEAVEVVAAQGGFPGAMGFRDTPERWAAYIRDSIIDPAIGRDLLVLEAIRRPSLLRQVFAICVGHAGEIVSLQKIAGTLTERGALETITRYLELLREAYLVTAVRKFSPRELRRRSSPPKLVPLNNAFITASMGPPPHPGSQSEQRGRLIENACLAFALNSGQTVHYWREEPWEVDAVLEGSWGRWALEVKTGPYSVRELAGLLEFVRRYPAYRPIVACTEAGLATAKRAGIGAVLWSQFLWSGLAGGR